MIIGLPLTAGTLPFTCYPATPQALYNAMFSLGSAQTTGLTGVVISASTPAPEDRDKAWIKLSGDNPIGIFKFAGANWIWPHPSAASGSERRLWVGEVADLVTYDGGDAGLIGAASGAMWEVDAEFVGRMPIGPGLIPGTATTAVVATNYGSGQHTLTVAELPVHNHGYNNQTSSFDYEGGNDGQGARPANIAQVSGNAGGGTPFEFIPPVRGAYFIKRTSRVFYRG